MYVIISIYPEITISLEAVCSFRPRGSYNIRRGKFWPFA